MHAKICVIDDVWATVGSDNLNRRSWTHDSELSCAVIDATLDPRSPTDPGGLGDGARRFARDLRLALWREHLGSRASETELLDLAHGSELWRRNADVATTNDEDRGGRIRPHENEPVSPFVRAWASVAYRLIFDPDGRPLTMRLRGRF